MSWCFVHAADLHLDTGFEGIGRTDERLRQRLVDASLAAFDALVELTLERDARFLVLAGDVYDGAERGLRAQLRFERGVRRLAEAGVPTFVAHGNHDPLGEGWALVPSWPQGVHVFGHHGVESVPVLHDGDVLAVVQGVSYERRAEARNLARLFTRTEHDVPHVAVLHANVGGIEGHDDYAPCTVDDLRRGGDDYWALGHVHQRTLLLDGSDGGPVALYPGNLQGRSPRVTERGEKGASVVPVVDGRIGLPEHVVLDRARFADGRAVVLRAVLRGAGTAHRDLLRAGAPEALRQALQDRLPADADAGWTAVKDRTTPPADDGALRGLVELLAPGPDDAELTGRARTEVDDRGWPADLPDDATLAAAGRALAVALLAGEDA